MSEKICCIEGCDNALRGHTARGMCKTHYNRFFKYGNPLAKDRRKMRVKNICKVDGCQEICKGQGYCSKHYQKYKKYGDPLFIHRKYNGEHSKEYSSWTSMIDRCYNTSHPAYKDYGGRGIKVCNRWNCGINGFYNFLEDMETRPEGYSLDRVDNNSGYCKENCRWTDSTTQNNNKRNNHYVTISGKTQTVTQWAREYNLPPPTIFSRIRAGKKGDELLRVTR